MTVELDWEVLTIAFFVVSSVVLTWVLRLRHLGREANSKKALAQAVAKNLHIPQTLHPIVDPDLCIGSLSCIKACPEGDILGVVDGRAVLINASACIGHGKCELECPVDAIKLVFGSSERGQDLPRVDEYFESSRPGVYIVGELGGMGLIKNALEQGLQVGKHLAVKFKGQARRGGNELVDIAIVGAGAAGLAAALACKEEGLTFRVLEQDSVGGTIAHYPRQKLVMTERVDLPLVGKFGKKIISKEELLGAWKKIVEKAQIRIEQGVKVEHIHGDDGGFKIATNRGDVKARKVVLAIGRRGTPRKLGVPGEDGAKVSYRLVDPEQYEGSRVLVVGGGDSALEAAIQLAEESDAQVTLSYRNAEFGKCRDANKKKFKDLVAKNHVHAVMSSQVVEVQKGAVILKTVKGLRQLPNDFVIACLGGELPTEFLKTIGVDMRRHFGTALGEEAPKTGEYARARRGSAKQDADRKRRWRFALGLTIIGVVVVAVLSTVGGAYYLLAPMERVKSPLHSFLKPAGVWGHGLGIVATLFMMSNFLYVFRKRWSALKGKGDIRTWMTLHQFVGILGPLVICFHAAFQSRNVLASATAVSVAIVVATGVVGRFFHGLMPTADGKETRFEDVVASWDRLKKRVEPMLDSLTNTSALRVMVAHASSAVPVGTTAAFVTTTFDMRKARKELERLRNNFSTEDQYEEFSETLERLLRMRTQVSFYRRLKRFISVWRIIHIVQAVLLVGMIAAHVAVTTYLGYRWIFS